MKLSPIILFVYNRINHTRKTIEALKKNALSNESDIVIYSDGAKSSRDINKIKLVRQYLKTIKGFKSIRIIERKENFGLARNITLGLTEVINKYGCR